MNAKKSMLETLMLVDSHAHLDCVEDLGIALARAKSDGIGKIITVGTSIESSKKCLEIVNKYSSRDLKIYAAVGIHPKDGKDDIEKYGSLKNCINKLKEILREVYPETLRFAQSDNRRVQSDKRKAQDDKIIVGIGETGLDYRIGSNQSPETSDQEKEFQRELFETHIKLAAESDIPLIIHCRNAWDDVLSLLTTDYILPTKIKGVFHSFTGDWQAAQKALDLGFYISFSGIVTFDNAQEIREVAKKAPLDRILVETDSPYLSPEPFRGGPPKLPTCLSTTIRRRLVERNRRVYKKNEPKNVRIVGSFLANIRNQSLADIITATSKNARRLFRI